MKIIEPDICPRCGAEFHCSKSPKCWCYEVNLPLSILEKIEEKYTKCLCPKCLNELNQKSDSKELVV